MLQSGRRPPPESSEKIRSRTRKSYGPSAVRRGVRAVPQRPEPSRVLWGARVAWSRLTRAPTAHGSRMVRLALDADMIHEMG